MRATKEEAVSETGEEAIAAIEEAAIEEEAVIEEDRFLFREFRVYWFRGFRNDSTLIIQQLIIDYVTAKKIKA